MTDHTQQAGAAHEGLGDRLFDLNIEEVLDHWGIEHAIREVIANALDEQILTSTRDVEIYEEGGVWHIRDFGRGLQIEHFTLNENKEKLTSGAEIIGKFGVGLKDALATFHRRGVAVTIRSQHGTFRLREAHKHNFDDITTLHVEYEPGGYGPGTDFELRGVSGADMRAAKELFLRFTDAEVVETTDYGQVLRSEGRRPRVYITGVFANEEPSFLFSYNITSLTPAMKKRLNRERLNVGRTIYADRVKAILRTASSDAVCDALADQVYGRARGDQCDEMQWIEIAQRALNLLHERTRVAFISEAEMHFAPDVVDQMRRDGYEVVMVSDAHKTRLDEQYEGGDTDLRTMEGFLTEFNDSFNYQFVERDQLADAERHVLDRTAEILELIGIGQMNAPQIRISETMRIGLDTTNGVWDTALRTIVIKRNQLRSLADFAGTLLHEAAHATTGAPDVTRQFESVLTDYLGQTAQQAVSRRLRPQGESTDVVGPSEQMNDLAPNRSLVEIRARQAQIDALLTELQSQPDDAPGRMAALVHLKAQQARLLADLKAEKLRILEALREAKHRLLVAWDSQPTQPPDVKPQLLNDIEDLETQLAAERQEYHRLLSFAASQPS